MRRASPTGITLSCFLCNRKAKLLDPWTCSLSLEHPSASPEASATLRAGRTRILKSHIPRIQANAGCCHVLQTMKTTGSRLPCQTLIHQHLNAHFIQRLSASGLHTMGLYSVPARAPGRQACFPGYRLNGAGRFAACNLDAPWSRLEGH